MGQSTEELTSDIERTRASLSRDIDELGDKVSPGRVVQRRKEAARNRFGTVRDKLMGTASHARGRSQEALSGSGSAVGERVSGAADAVSGTASGAVGTLERRTEGNPLAAGLVAFGAGMLISALIPASEREAEASQRLVETAKDKGQPLKDEATSLGKEMGEHLKESAQQSAHQVQASAREAAGTVKEEGRSSAGTVAEDARRQTS